jgi:hypothetical protein
VRRFRGGLGWGLLINDKKSSGYCAEGHGPHCALEDK